MKWGRNIVLLAIFITMALLSSCKDEIKSVVKQSTDPNKVPTVVSHDVQTIISDSGRTRYRITTKLWQMFNEAHTPHWTFPNGVVADELDENYHNVASLICDSAYYNLSSHMWSAIGNVRLTMRNGDKVLCNRMYYDENLKQVNCMENVRITRTTGDRILTNQMYYENTTRITHGDGFIHIEGGGRVIEGYGYQYLDRDKRYKIDNEQGIVPIDDRKFRPTSHR